MQESTNQSLSSFPSSLPENCTTVTSSIPASIPEQPSTTVRIDQVDLKSLLEEKESLSFRLFELQAQYNTFRYQKEEEKEELNDKIERLTAIEEQYLYYKNQNNLITEIDKK